MNLGGSSFPGDGPFEDPDGSADDETPVPSEELHWESSGGLTGDEDALRGWIPPDDRLWLHPSEIGRESRRASVDARPRVRRSDRLGLLAAGVVGTAALTAAIAAVALAATSSNPASVRAPASLPPHFKIVGPTSTMSDLNPSASEECPASWMSATACKAVKMVEPSMLRIVVGSGQAKAEGTGVAVSVAGETVAITAASLVGKSQSVEAFNSSGVASTLDVLGVDDESGIAVVKVPWTMPVVSIAQETVTPGQWLMLACLGRGSDALVPAIGEVNEADVSAQLMDAIEVDVTALATPGGVLLNSSGSVLGILGEMHSSPGDEMGEFVPAWLAVGVATKLVETHQVVHGWLDVKGTTAQGIKGAVVVSVTRSGPAAAAGLKPGDVVVGISTSSGRDPIESMADLRGRLYLEPPGARVELDVVRGSQAMVLSPVLAAAIP
jgi:serine protease Do